MSNCFTHKNTQAIAECRICGKNVCDGCGIEIGKGQGFACCNQCEQKIRSLIHKKEIRSRIWIFSLLGITVALTLALIFPLLGHETPTSILLSLFPTAGMVVLCVYFIYYFSFHIYMRITRGAPFRLGDYVAITDGPHKEAQGEVQRLGDRLGVVVALEVDGVTSNYCFDWFQIRKIKKRRS